MSFSSPSPALTVVPDTQRGLDYPFGTRDTQYTRKQFKILHDVKPKLLAALQDRDFQMTAFLWSTLIENRLIGLVLPKYWMDVSWLISQIGDEVPEDTDTSLTQALDLLAVHAAATGPWEGLGTRMRHYVSNGHPNTAVRLFITCFKLNRQRAILFQDQAALSLSEYEKLRSRIGARGDLSSHLICHVITAFAAKNSFHEAVYFFHHPSVRPYLTMTYSTLESGMPLTTDDVILLKKAHEYGRRLRLAKILSLPLPFFQRTVSRLLYRTALYDTHYGLGQLLQELSDLDHSFIALHPSSVSTTKPLLMEDSSEHWNILTRAAIQQGNIEFAQQLRDQLGKLFSKVPVGVWAATLNGFADLGKFDQIQATWDTLRSAEPDRLPPAEAHQAYLSALFLEGRSDDAMHVFDTFRQSLHQGLLPAQEPAISAVFNVVLGQLVHKSRVDEAWDMMTSMQHVGLSPGVDTYNIFLRYFAMTGDVQRLKSTFNELSTSTVDPNIESYSWLVVGFRTAYRDAVHRVLEEMRRNGIEPSTNDTAEPMLRLLTRRDQSQHTIAAAISILEYLDRHLTGPLRPTEGALVIVQCAIERKVWADSALEASYRNTVMQIARRHDRSLAARTYSCLDLLRACFENPTPEATLRAWQYYREFIEHFDKRSRRGIASEFLVRPDLSPTIWLQLLDGLRERKNWELADELVRELGGWYKVTEPPDSLARSMHLARRRNPDPIAEVVDTLDAIPYTAGAYS